MAVYENRNRMPPSTSADSGHCHEILRDINIDNVTYQPWQRKYLDRDCDIARDKTLSQVPPFCRKLRGIEIAREIFAASSRMHFKFIVSSTSNLLQLGVSALLRTCTFWPFIP
jgi:hypothetical protein